MSQYLAIAKIGRIEKQLQTMQQVEMAVSTAKDLMLVDSFDG